MVQSTPTTVWCSQEILETLSLVLWNAICPITEDAVGVRLVGIGTSLITQRFETRTRLCLGLEEGKVRIGLQCTYIGGLHLLVNSNHMEFWDSIAVRYQPVEPLMTFRLYMLECISTTLKVMVRPRFPFSAFFLPSSITYMYIMYPCTGRPNVTSLLFQLVKDGTNPFQSSPPVFTLTCTSSGGPATNVKWKSGNEALTENSNHVMSRTLVDQLGPDYSSTLTVTGRNVGTYSCNVSNYKGYSTESYKVEGL